MKPILLHQIYFYIFVYKLFLLFVIVGLLILHYMYNCNTVTILYVYFVVVFRSILHKYITYLHIIDQNHKQMQMHRNMYIIFKEKEYKQYDGITIKKEITLEIKNVHEYIGCLDVIPALV